MSTSAAPDTAKWVDDQMERHYGATPASTVAGMSRTFREEGYVRVPSFAPPAVVEAVRREAHELHARLSVRRELVMEATGNTPRKLTNVRSVDVAREGRFIPALYYSQALTRRMAEIFGEPCHVVPYENERFMLLSESRAGDTHGWHWDDYAFSLIWLIEAPPPEMGGWVEFVPRTLWHKGDPDTVNFYLRERKVERRDHVRDDVYLLRGDTSMHRVAPLHGDVLRLVLNLAWASTEDLSREISHETLDGLYA